MQLVHLLFQTLLGILVAPSHGERIKCYQLPTDIAHDARETLQPYGERWMLYRSNLQSDRCLRMEYVGNREGNAHLATFTLHHQKSNNYEAMTVYVGKNMDNWTTVDDHEEEVVYYQLVINDSKHFWCIYSCQMDLTNIEHIRCGVLDEKGKIALDNYLDLHYPELPLEGQQRLMVVYDHLCTQDSTQT